MQNEFFMPFQNHKKQKEKLAAQFKIRRSTQKNNKKDIRVGVLFVILGAWVVCNLNHNDNLNFKLLFHPLVLIRVSFFPL